LSTDVKPILEGLLENQNPLCLLANIFHHGPQYIDVLQLGWLQICVGENIFTEHALGLLQILSFSDASETKTNIVIIPFSFLRHDEGL